MIRLGLLDGVACCAGFCASPDPKSLAIPAEEMSRARELVANSEAINTRSARKPNWNWRGWAGWPAPPRGGRQYRSEPGSPHALCDSPSEGHRARQSRPARRLPGRHRWEVRARPAGLEPVSRHDPRANGRCSATRCGRTASSTSRSRGVRRDDLVDREPADRDGRRGATLRKLGSIVAARRQELYIQKFPRTSSSAAWSSGDRRAARPNGRGHRHCSSSESLVPSKFVPRAASVSSLISASGFAMQLATRTTRDRCIGRWPRAWIDSRTDPIDMYQTMTIAEKPGPDGQGCRLGIKLLNTPARSATYRGTGRDQSRADREQGAHSATRQGPRRFDGGLHHPRESGGPGDQRTATHDVQVTDMALAVGVILSGQKLEDYGFVDNFLRAGGIRQLRILYSRHYIPEPSGTRCTRSGRRGGRRTRDGAVTEPGDSGWRFEAPESCLEYPQGPTISDLEDVMIRLVAALLLVGGLARPRRRRFAGPEGPGDPAAGIVEGAN